MEDKRTILIIEDDYSLRTAIIKLLEVNNFSTIAFADGESALKIIKLVRPDLIICDIILPGIDGFEVLKHIKEQFENEEPIPFIYLTAKVDNGDFRKGMSLGADDYITKPFKSQDLLDSIKTRLRKFDNIRQNKREKELRTLDKNQGIIISDKKKSEFIRVDDIAFISASGDYSDVHLTKGKVVSAQKSLKEWEEILPGNIFYRTHRSFIVNINHIKEIKPFFKRSYKIMLKEMDDDVFISERYVVRLRKLLLNP